MLSLSSQDTRLNMKLTFVSVSRFKNEMPLFLLYGLFDLDAVKINPNR